MGLKKRLGVVLLCLALTGSFLMPTNSRAQKEVELYRVAGSNRYHTAQKISEVIYYDTLPEQVILVNADSFPDGLTAGIAGAVMNAPVFLVDKNSVSPVVQNEIRRLNVKKALIIGGESQVSAQLMNEMKKITPKIERISGENRYQTAERVARKMKQYPQVNKKLIGVASGENFADVLASGAYLGNARIPLVLASRDGGRKENIQSFARDEGISKLIVFGGAGSLPDRALPQNIATVRLAGENRYETAVKIAQSGFKDSSFVIIASGENFADALAAAPLARYFKCPILLASKTGLSDDVIEQIAGGPIKNVIVVGGKTTLPDHIFDRLNPKKDIRPWDPNTKPQG